MTETDRLDLRTCRLLIAGGSVSGGIRNWLLYALVVPPG